MHDEIYDNFLKMTKEAKESFAIDILDDIRMIDIVDGLYMQKTAGLFGIGKKKEKDNHNSFSAVVPEVLKESGKGFAIGAAIDTIAPMIATIAVPAALTFLGKNTKLRPELLTSISSAFDGAGRTALKKMNMSKALGTGMGISAAVKAMKKNVALKDEESRKINEIYKSMHLDKTANEDIDSIYKEAAKRKKGRSLGINILRAASNPNTYRNTAAVSVGLSGMVAGGAIAKDIYNKGHLTGRESMLLRNDHGELKNIKANVPSWKVPDFKYIMQDSLPIRFMPAEYIKGSAIADSTYQKNSLKEIGSYIKNNPKRFLNKGVGMSALGAGLVVGGGALVKRVYDRHKKTASETLDTLYKEAQIDLKKKSDLDVIDCEVCNYQGETDVHGYCPECGSLGGIKPSETITEEIIIPIGENRTMSLMEEDTLGRYDEIT